ncbi:AAA family ATPase [Isosphaeraceae bacterium EP7]
MAKVINLRVENILGLAKAEAKPNGKSVTIGGENGQGKSSLQNALKMILGGKDFVPAEPVKRGAEKGTGHLVLDNGFEIDFEVMPDRKTKLKIRQQGNTKFTSDSVTLLKELFGSLSFDPGEWMAMPPKAKLETLRKLTGLDFTEFNAKRDEAYESRTEHGRELKRLEGQLSGLAWHEDAPKAEVSIVDLTRELDAAQSAIATHDKQVAAVEALEKSVRERDEQIEDIDADLARLEAKKKSLAEKRAADASRAEKGKALTDSFQRPDVEAIRARQATVEATNRKVRENGQRAAVQAELTAAMQAVAKLTKQIESVDAEKAKLLAGAKLPVEGLRFDEDSIRFKDSPWEQCSEAEQWDVATAISFALNPQGVVFMSRSGGLDKRSRARVMQRAAERGVQLFLEAVDDAQDVQIVIHHGEVVADRLEPAASEANEVHG